MASQTIPSPKGRFVQGDAFNPQTKDQQGNPLTIKTGPNAGQPTQKFIMAVAFAKNDPETLPYLLQLARDAATAWPTFFPQGAVQAPPLFGCTHPRFSLKIMDGDGIDDNGKPNNQKEGFAGHWVVKYSSSFAPKVYEAGKWTDFDRVDTDKAKHSLLKRGFFVKIGASWESNNNDQRPGMYVNLQMVEIQHAGPEITSGPDASAVFGSGGAAPSSATTPAPAAPSGGLVATGAHSIEQLRAAGWTDDAMIAAGHARRDTPPVPPSPAAAPPAPPVPSPAASTGAPATPSPSSYTGYMDPAAAPPPPAAPAAPQRVMLPAAGAHTYEQLIAAGWTDAMLVQNGMMQA